MKTEMTNNNKVKDSKELLTTSTSTFTLDELENNYRQLKLKGICDADGEKIWSVLKKNVNLFGPSFTRDKDLYLISKLSLEAESHPKFIPGQHDQYVHQNKYVKTNNDDAANERSKTLPTVQQQEYMQWNQDFGMTSPLVPKKQSKSSNISCEAMKVKIMGLRRVSNHTVLIKWKVPRDTTNVEGYELLVDGRAVQTILSSSRCMAIVSCLPNLEQVLITIRTIVESVPHRDHYPSTTIIYQPRNR